MSRETAPLSILAVTPEFDNGGTEGQLLELGQGLIRGGDRYRIVTGGGTQLARLAAAGIAHRVVRQRAGQVSAPVELAAYTRAVLRELLAEPADIIQSTAIRTTYIAALAVAAAALRHPLRRVPAIVTTLHGGKQGDLYGRAARHLRLVSDSVITVSESGRAALLAHRFPASRVVVVPPGRDLAAFFAVAEGSMAPAELVGVPPGARVVLTVGRLAPLKGLNNLIDAWEAVARAVHDAYLVIAGNGDLEGDLRRQAAQSPAADRIVFAGFRSDVPALLARADLFVLSSLWEGLPMAAAEALAARRPVVATAVGGTPEVIADGATGLLVPPRDPAALAAALVAVLGDAALAARLAAAGQRQVRARYTREALVSATRAVYLQTLAQRSAHAAALMPYGF
jgi:glycosyltransferase involved in cell wall biosynthesis